MILKTLSKYLKKSTFEDCTPEPSSHPKYQFFKSFGYIFGFLSLIIFIGCSKKNNQNSEKYLNQILNLSILSDVRSLDPRVGNDYPSALIIKMLYEGLMRMGSDGKITKGIADSYDISDDQKTYTFHLRSATWSNGDPVTAFDFEYAWKKAIDPQYAKTGSFTFYVIKNVAACLEERATLDEVGIKAIDERTLIVELEHPTPYFLSLTTCSTFAPICKKNALERPDWSYHGDKFFVSNGPFYLEKWQKGDCITLKKNRKYWDKSNVYLSRINIMIIPDATTQYYMFEKGDIDWIGSPFGKIPLDLIKGLYQEKKVHHLEAMGLNWLFINTKKFPLTNKNFRKALASAIDRKTICENLLQKGEKVALGILGSEFSEQIQPYFEDGNKELASEYLQMALDELGMTLEDLPPISISFPSTDSSFRLVQAIQQQLEESLGIKILLNHSEWMVHFNNITNGSYELGLMSWVSWINDPIYFLNTFREEKLATNMSRWEHPLYKYYLNRSDNETDICERKKDLVRAEALLMSEMPVIPLHYMTMSYAYNPKLKNFYLSTLYEIDFKEAYFSDSDETEKL